MTAMSTAPSAAPIPIPAFAPVDSPLLEGDGVGLDGSVWDAPPEVAVPVLASVIMGDSADVGASVEEELDEAGGEEDVVVNSLPGTPIVVNATAASVKTVTLRLSVQSHGPPKQQNLLEEQYVMEFPPLFASTRCSVSIGEKLNATLVAHTLGSNTELRTIRTGPGLIRARASKIIDGLIHIGIVISG